jgi:hypothetical protein
MRLSRAPVHVLVLTPLSMSPLSLRRVSCASLLWRAASCRGVVACACGGGQRPGALCCVLRCIGNTRVRVFLCYGPRMGWAAREDGLWNVAL